MANDDKLWFQAGYQPKRRTRTRGQEVWTLRQGTRTLRCELRDDSRIGAGVDVQALEDDEPVFTQRCADEDHARRLAAALCEDFERQGWSVVASPSP